MGYEAYQTGNTTLRDQLAIDRTDFSNTRTLLAFASTSIVIAVSGLTIYKIEGKQTWTLFLLWITLGLSSLIIIYGFSKYHYFKNQIQYIDKAHHNFGTSKFFHHEGEGGGQ